MTMRKLVLTVSIVTIAFTTFASDLLPVSAPILAGRLDGSESIPSQDVAAARTQSVGVELPRNQMPVAVLQETVSNAASSAVAAVEPAQPLEVAALDSVATNGEHFESENTWSIPATLRDSEALKAADKPHAGSW